MMQSHIEYVFERGYPTPETTQRIYDEIDLNRAIQAYRFFYPTVAFSTVFINLKTAGIDTNKNAAIMECNPGVLVFTANSDTPYAILPIDLEGGPMVIEMPAGPLMGVANDLNQRYVMDLGLPGPDGGKGGKHLLVPPNFEGDIPPGFHLGHPTTQRLSIALRGLPIQGDEEGAIELMKKVRIYPLVPSQESTDIKWINISDRAIDTTPLSIETSLGFWEILHEIISTEPAYEAYRNYYGELAALGIVKGMDFAPDQRMIGILEEAARIGNAQMRVQSFADRRPDRMVWSDRKWEWATLRPENGTFDAPSFVDLQAREKWFYQAVLESPAMFARKAGQGSVYWLGIRDREGNYLDGSKSYSLIVPLPVPASLFWSVTVYDASTRSEIQTEQNAAALRSLFELRNKLEGKELELYFGPRAPDQDKPWIKTIPDRGWFVYFRVYGPQQPTFDGTWKLSDFEALK